MSGFLASLQQAYFRGIPFYVDAQQVQKGRKIAVHDYPFRDGGWAEDMGRKQRIFRFQGHLIGDEAPLLQLVLDAALEKSGPGLLIHPTLGAMQVVVMSATSAVSKDRLRVISLELTFLEQGSSLFPSIVTNTINDVLDKFDSLLAAIPTGLLSIAVIAAAAGAQAATESSNVTASFGANCTSVATDPGGIVAMATALPPPDSDTSYGLYANGSATAAIPVGTTVADLQSQLAVQRGIVAEAVTSANTAATLFSASTAPNVVSTLSALVESARATMTNPADQVRTLLALATFTYSDTQGGNGLGGELAAIRNAFAQVARRTALGSLALACAAYQPSSYQDAETLRSLVSSAFDIEITAAGDAGDDDDYVALKQLRASVIQDLTTRGASLPLVITVSLPSSLPSLVVAYRLYQDSTRANQVAVAADVPHPAFLPTSLQVLAS
jgi:prophage DNA circulation protein